MALKIIQTGEEPVDIETAKNHLRVDIDDDNALIQSLITAAREYCESFTLRAITTQTLEYMLDTFPDGPILLPRPPLINVDSIMYKDVNGAEIILDPSSYIVDADSEPAKIYPTNGEWPSFEPYPVNAVHVRYLAGYEENLPKSIRQAMLLLIGHWYENREATVIGNVANNMPFAVESLLWPHRVWMA
jgi:uncharacterized phiE125 gp8 family phage protein